MRDNKDKNSILIVDDEKSNIMALSMILSPDYVIYAAKNGRDAIEIAQEYLPDVILLDILMPEMDGYDVISRLKGMEETESIPVIFVTGLTTAGSEVKGLDLGAADYIIKPFSPAIVKLRVRNQIKIVNQIRIINHLSTTDQLTGIPNRRSFNTQMNREWSRNMRENSQLSFLMIDVDKFKVFNDTFGHQAGDELLQLVAKTLAESLRRAADFAARWGGEEFAVLLPGTDTDGAVEIAERIRSNIENTKITLSYGKITSVTVSIGLSTLIPSQETSPDDIIFQADKALYDAKESGRNRVIVHKN